MLEANIKTVEMRKTYKTLLTFGTNVNDYGLCPLDPTGGVTAT